MKGIKAMLLMGALAALLICLLSGPAMAEIAGDGQDITDSCTVSPGMGVWLDGKESSWADAVAGQTIVIESKRSMGGLYLVFDRMPKGDYTVNGRTYAPDYLHKYIPLDASCEDETLRVEVTFSTDTSIADLYVLSPGELPAFVQAWEPPCEQADLLLAPTHADDDQLFFLGILPEYAAQRELAVQVVYYTNHNNVHNRPHELLNGLWTVGVRNYPVIAEMQDAWDGATKTLEFGYQLFEKQGYDKGELVDFWVEIIRRFQPQVIVGHDIQGEYGHPQHMVNTDTLIEALKVCGDAAYESERDPYLPEKVYLHLYGENEIVLDWDKPLSAFGGKTAYEVSKEGYACHLSQQWTWFTGWIKGKEGQFTKSTQITSYSPNRYGLYFTQVGVDTVGGDFFENLTPRSQIPPVTEPETTLPPETDPVTTAPPMTDPITTAPPETATPQTTIPESTGRDETIPTTEAPGENSGKGGMVIALAFAGGLAILGCALILHALRMRVGRGGRR